MFCNATMKKLQMGITNPYVSKRLRADRKPTVFTRAFERLWKEGKDPGLLIPIFLRMEDDYKVFGVFSLNSGGSVSFFPDFYKLDNFHHLTLNKDFIKKKGHLTKVEVTGKHKKSIHFEANVLHGSSFYHLITFVMKDGDLLMDATEQIECADIHYQTEQQRQLYNTWIKRSVAKGHCILSFPDGNGSYAIQILIRAKAKSVHGLSVNRDPLEAALLDRRSLEKENFNVRIVTIDTPEKSDFTIVILTLRIPYELKTEFAFYLAQNPEKPIHTGHSS
jgi:hypothetical protein